MRYVGITFRGGTNPNFNNLEAWGEQRNHIYKLDCMDNVHGLHGEGSMNYMVMILALAVMEEVV